MTEDIKELTRQTKENTATLARIEGYLLPDAKNGTPGAIKEIKMQQEWQKIELNRNVNLLNQKISELDKQAIKKPFVRKAAGVTLAVAGTAKAAETGLLAKIFAALGAILKQ